MAGSESLRLVEGCGWAGQRRPEGHCPVPGPEAAPLLQEGVLGTTALRGRAVHGPQREKRQK